MLYKTKKVLCSSLVISLLNTSFYPLYAGHKHHPMAEDSGEENKRPRPRGLVLEDYLQNKFNSSAQTIQIWTPAFIKNSVSSVFNAIGSWFDNMIEELPPHMFAKTYFEIDYARDRDYWRAHFTTAIEELKSALDQDRLEDLQDIVWNGLISPYLFEEGVKELDSHYASSSKNDSLNSFSLSEFSFNEFHKTLKSSPGFITQSFHRDLLDVLKNIRHFGDGIDGFKAMLTYYREFENSLDYKQSLNAFSNELQRRKKEKTLPLTNKQYAAFDKGISEAISKTKTDECRNIKNERYSNGLFSRALPFYNEDLPEIFNSSLSPILPIVEEPISLLSSFKGNLKGLTLLVSDGMKFAKEHPFEAMCMGLLTQVTVAAALNSFKVNGFKGQKDNLVIKDIESQKESEPNKERRYAKRAVGDEFQINQNSTGILSSATFFPNGNVFVSWQNLHAINDGLARIYNGSGIPLTDEFPLGAVSGSSTPLPNGNAFVTLTGSGVYARAFNSTGFPLTNVLPFSDNSSFSSPLVVASSNGNIYGVWARQESTINIYGRVLNATFATLSPKDLLLANGTSPNVNPSLAAFLDGSGRVFAAWGRAIGVNRLYGRVFDGNWNPLTNETQLTNAVSYEGQYTPSAVALSNENIFLVWRNTNGNNYTIQGRVFNSSLFPLTDQLVLSRVAAGSRNSPSFTEYLNEYVFGTWYWSDPLNAYTPNIYGRLFNKTTLSPLTDEILINQDMVSGTGLKVVSLNESLFITWSSYTSGDYNVKGRFLTKEFFNLTSSQTSKIPVSTQKVRTTPLASSSKPDNTPVIVGATLGTLCAVPLIGTGIYYGVKKYKKSSRRLSPEEVRLEEAPGIQAETIVGEKKRQFQLIKLMDLSTFQTLEKITGIPFDEEKIRSGAHGTVKPAIEINPKTEDFVDVVAAKFIEGEEMIEHSKNELDILQELGKDQNNPHTSYLLDSYVYNPEGENVLRRKFPQKTEIIFTHWFSGGDGNDFVERLPLLTNGQDKTLLLNSLIKGLFHAVEYINETKTIFHNDINPGNVLLDMKTGYFRLNDWGSASQTPKLTGHERIKKGYLSPERFAFIKGQTKIQPDAAQSDSWSMAVVSWEFLFNGINPFKDVTTGNMDDTIDDLSQKNKDQKDGLTPELLNIFQKRLTAKQALGLKILSDKDTTTTEWRVQILMDLITKQRQKKNTKQDENSFKSYEMSKINHMNQDDKYLNQDNPNYEGIPTSPSEKLKQLGSKVQERNYINVTTNGNKNTSTNLPLTDSKDKSSERHYENVLAADESPYEGMPEVKNKDNTYENLPKVDEIPYEGMPETEKESMYGSAPKNQ